MNQKTLSFFFFIIVFLLCKVCIDDIYAQSSPSIPNSKAGNVEDFKKTEDTTRTQRMEANSTKPVFLVTRVYLAGNRDINKGGLGDEIEIEIDSLQKMLDGYEQEQWSHFELYIDGKKIKGLYGEPLIYNNTFRYKLSRTDSSSDGWQSILNKPTFFDGKKRVTITVGTDKRGPLNTIKVDKNFDFVIVKPFNLILYFVVLIIFGFITWYLGKHTAMLREPGLDDIEPLKKPYSLALVQMTFWFFLVVSSTLMLWLITRDFPNITGSVLILMGVSAVTALSSASVNINRKSETIKNNLLLKAEDKMLKSRIAVLEDIIKPMPIGIEKEQVQNEWEEKTKRLNEITVLLQQLPDLKKLFITKGFWKDLITEEGNVSLNRFQIGVWTLVLGSYFVFSVWSSLTLPQFNETLLALMGISSGTYIGFKIQSSKSQ